MKTAFPDDKTLPLKERKALLMGRIEEQRAARIVSDKRYLKRTLEFYDEFPKYRPSRREHLLHLLKLADRCGYFG